MQPMWQTADFGERVQELVHQIEHCGHPELAIVTHTELISELLRSYVHLSHDGTPPRRLLEQAQRVHAAMLKGAVVVEATFSFSKSLARKEGERPIMHFAMRHPAPAAPLAG